MATHMEDSQAAESTGSLQSSDSDVSTLTQEHSWVQEARQVLCGPGLLVNMLACFTIDQTNNTGFSSCVFN